MSSRLEDIGKTPVIPKIQLTVEQAEQLGLCAKNKFTCVVDGEFAEIEEFNNKGEVRG